MTFSFAIGGAQEGVIGFFEDIENLDRVVLLTQAGFSVPESSYKKTFFWLHPVRRQFIIYQSRER